LTAVPAAIEIRDLVKRYGSLEAVRGISLSVEQGAFYGFLGPNGAGKSTTIHIITGLCSRTSGEVSVFGRDVTRDYVFCRRQIGLAPQEFNFDRFFSIRKILEYEAGYFGMRSSGAKTRVQELLERFGLWDKRDEKCTKLSGGLKRRLLVAKALVHDPDILILDEPTAGLDVELRLELWQYLRELNRAGKTILLTTHYLEEAEELCGEIAIIHHGKIIRRGTKEDLLGSSGRSLQEVFLKATQGQEAARG
jgi:ABC-2 type transport system ATP-binding protein